MDVGLQIFVAGVLVSAAIALIVKTVIDHALNERGLYPLSDPRNKDGKHPFR